MEIRRHVKFRIASIFITLVLSGFANNMLAQRISTGNYNVLYVCEDGTISAIGNNYSGELGDGTYINRSYPVKVKGLHDVVGVNAYGCLAWLSDGTVWQWVDNWDGVASYLEKINIDSVVRISCGYD